MIGRLELVRRRLQGQAATDDAGFVLIYVMMVITVVTILVTGVLVTSASSIVPAQQSAYDEAAFAAAQAGIQAMTAEANYTCSTAAVSGSSTPGTACTSVLPATMAGSWVQLSPTTYAHAAYSAQYKLSFAATSDSQKVRVTSIGKVVAGGVSASRTLVADLSAGASTNCFNDAICTQYETQSPDVMNKLFPSRTIPLDSTYLPYADAVSNASGSSVSWNGPSTAATTNGGVSVCNTTWLGSGSSGGRETNGPSGATTPFVDWTESGTLGSSGVTDYQPCQVSLGSSTRLVAPGNTANGVGGYVTADAPLLSNSNPGGTGGPLLNEPLYTTYSPSSDPSGVAGQYYRSFTLPGYSVPVGGTPASGSTYAPASGSAPSTVTSAPTVPANSCVYKGPTRVLLNSNGTATITSPQTTANLASSPSGCYPSSMTGGIYQWTTGTLSSIPNFSGVFSVRNNGTAPNPTTHASTSTGWYTTGQTAYTTSGGTTSATAPSSGNTAFYWTANPSTTLDTSTVGALTTGCGSSNAISATCAFAETANPPTQPDGVNGWTAYSSAKQCWAVSRNQATPNGPKPTDEQTFDCDWFNQMGQNWLPPTTPNDGYALFRKQLATDLASTSAITINGYGSCASLSVIPGSATATQMTCLIDHDLRSANSNQQEYGWPNPVNLDRRYYAVGGTPTTTTTTQTVGTAPTLSTNGDKFFTNGQSGTASSETVTTTKTTYTVYTQAYACYGVLVLGACLLSVGGALLGYQWGDGNTGGLATPQFQFTLTQTSYSNLVSGNPAVVNFPAMSDVTQYATGSGGATGSNGPGDLYVEGTATTSLAFVAADDAIITGSLQPSAPTTTGIELAASDNVRVYHPVSCLSTATNAQVAGTTAGFCPDDLTGLYKTIPATGYRPYQQYTNLRTDLSGLSINAAVFALGLANTSSCPLWNGTGQCGGEFTVDNYNRGTSLSALSTTGMLFQVHHGALGEEWEVADTSGQTRPQSGYTLTATYQNLKTLLAGFTSLLSLNSSTSSSLWHVVSTTGSGS